MENESLKVRLFVIEDNLDECIIFRDYFNANKNIEVCGIATDAIEGIRKIRECNPDVVLTDFIMPGIDGSEIIRSVKAFSNKIKIIVLSGISDAKIADHALKQGADYYLVKPVMLPFLVKKVISVFKKDCNKNSYRQEKQYSVNRYIQDLGIPVELSSYHYIVQAVNIMVSSERVLMLKEINSIIADKNQTSIKCVDACIRNAITRASDTHNTKYVELFGDEEKQPSNYLFLRTIKEAICGF